LGAPPIVFVFSRGMGFKFFFLPLLMLSPSPLNLTKAVKYFDLIAALRRFLPLSSAFFFLPWQTGHYFQTPLAVLSPGRILLVCRTDSYFSPIVSCGFLSPPSSRPAFKSPAVAPSTIVPPILRFFLSNCFPTTSAPPRSRPPFLLPEYIAGPEHTSALAPCSCPHWRNYADRTTRATPPCHDSPRHLIPACCHGPGETRTPPHAPLPPSLHHVCEAGCFLFFTLGSMC